jgi:hypothetical protein
VAGWSVVGVSVSLLSCLFGVMAGAWRGALCRRVACPPPVMSRSLGVSRGVLLVLGSLILGSCAGENLRPLLPAVLQFDFCNISQNRQFLGLVGLI